MNSHLASELLLRSYVAIGWITTVVTPLSNICILDTVNLGDIVLLPGVNVPLVSFSVTLDTSH